MNPSNAKEKTQRQIEEALQKTWSKMTSKQRYAVEIAPKAQRDILVSAAAGSGKTFVLVQRIVALLLLHEKDIRKMLLATFTNAAAAQMQKRIQSAISELIYTEQINSPHLKEQLMYLNGADISTLHAFCMKMIRSYFHILDIVPDFTILQGAEEVLLREETMREVLESFLSREDEAFLAVYEMYTPFRKPLAMGDMILEIYDYAMSRPEGLSPLRISLVPTLE
jgi:ATP-dependent helicase/nuclease subunit A